MIPVYGFVRGDVLGILVLAQGNQTIAELAVLVQQAATTRVAPAERADVYLEGKRLDPEATVALSGLSALDRVDVVPEENAHPRQNRERAKPTPNKLT